MLPFFEVVVLVWPEKAKEGEVVEKEAAVQARVKVVTAAAVATMTAVVAAVVAAAVAPCTTL